MFKRLVAKSSGSEALWTWFQLSRSSFCILPRVLMHEMSDEWQGKMAELLNEWDDAWNWDQCGFDGCRVQVYKGQRYVKAPAWLLNYRHPDRAEIEKRKKSHD